MKALGRPRIQFLTAVLALALAGCSSSDSSAGSQPRRPDTGPPSAVAAPPPPSLAELRLDGFPPCGLLTPAQLATIGRPRAIQRGSTGCAWAAGIGQRPQNDWTVSTTGSGLGPGFLANNPPMRIDGFPASEPTDPVPDARSCQLYIDTAHDQTLGVSFSTSPDYPGITHQVACAQGARVADLVLTTGRAMARQPAWTGPVLSGGAKPTLPPRPAPLRLDGKDPCALLAPNQAAVMQLPQGQAAMDPAGPTCVWSAPDLSQRNATLITNSGAASALRPEANSQDVTVLTLGGYGAVQSTSRPYPSNQQCTLDIDVADNQDLRVQYHFPPDATGADHRTACDRAAQFAANLLTALRGA